MFKFITIDEHIDLSVSDDISARTVCISANKSKSAAPAIFVNGILAQQVVCNFRDVLGDVEAEKHYEETGEEVAYCLVPPDPWLLAVMYVMWEGVIQGVAWDGVKLLVSKALAKLRANNLAPVDKKNMKRKFMFTAYIDIANLFRVFVKLQSIKENNEPDPYILPTIKNPPDRHCLGDGLVTPTLSKPKQSKLPRTSRRKETAKTLAKTQSSKRSRIKRTKENKS